MAFILRMPIRIRRMIEGVKTKKVNRAFIEIDKQMNWHYTIGYVIAYINYGIMTAVVSFFNFFYPTAYCMTWLYCIFALYFFDMLLWTGAVASFQLVTSLFTVRYCRCCYYCWFCCTVCRQYKNLRN